MDEFEAIAELVYAEIQGRSEEEQKQILASAIAIERYRTINDVQMHLSGTRVEIERLLPSDFARINNELRYRMITAAELVKHTKRR